MQTLKMVAGVAAGGAVGAVARYFMTHWVTRLTGAGFPYGTLAVNITGAFLMGIVISLLALRYNLSPVMQSFVVTGVLGGFTTFSTFTLESAVMIQRHDYGPAGLYMVASVLFCVVGLFGGMAIARMIVS